MEPDLSKAESTILYFGTWTVSIGQAVSGFLRQPLRIDAEQSDSGRWFATSVASAANAQPTTGANARATASKPPAPPSSLSPMAAPVAPVKSPFAGRNVALVSSRTSSNRGAAPRPPERKHSALIPAQRPAFSMPVVNDDPNDPLNDVPY